MNKLMETILAGLRILISSCLTIGLIILILSCFLVGCSASNKSLIPDTSLVSFPAKTEDGTGSQLVYEHLSPVWSESTIKYGSNANNRKGSITNAEWIKEINYRDVGVGVSAVVSAITAPKQFPYSVALGAVDPICGILTQDSDVKVKQWDVLGHMETKRIYQPEGTYYLRVETFEKDKDGKFLPVTVEIAGTKEGMDLLKKHKTK